MLASLLLLWRISLLRVDVTPSVLVVIESVLALEDWWVDVPVPGVAVDDEGVGE